LNTIFKQYTKKGILFQMYSYGTSGSSNQKSSTSHKMMTFMKGA